MSRLLIIFFGVSFLLNSLESKAGNQNYLVRCNQKLVDVIMEDLFTPAVTSRVKVYPNVAAYEVLCKKDQRLLTLSSQLNQLTEISNPDKKVDYSLSALFAFTTVAKKLVYSEYMFTDFEKADSKICSIIVFFK